MYVMLIIMCILIILIILLSNKIDYYKEIRDELSVKIMEIEKELENNLYAKEELLQENYNLKKSNEELQRLLSKSYAGNEKILQNIAEKFDFNNKKA